MDTLSKIQRSRLMSKIGGKNTAPEIKLRKLLSALGYRYRLHKKELPGTPDIVFVALKKVIFVHGCFWHGHHCKAGRPPSTNKAYWLPKLEGNKRRDRKKRLQLTRMGWKSLVIWQCEIKKKLISKKIEKFLATQN